MSDPSADAADPHREALYRCEHLALPDCGRRFRRFADVEQVTFDADGAERDRGFAMVQLL